MEHIGHECLAIFFSKSGSANPHIEEGAPD